MHPLCGDTEEPLGASPSVLRRALPSSHQVATPFRFSPDTVSYSTAVNATSALSGPCPACGDEEIEYMRGARGGSASNRAASGGLQLGLSRMTSIAALRDLTTDSKYSWRPSREHRRIRFAFSASSPQCSASTRSSDFFGGPVSSTPCNSASRTEHGHLMCCKGF